MKCCVYDYPAAGERIDMPADLRQRAGILPVEDGGHDYHRHVHSTASSVCPCGARMGAFGSWGPDPFGRCPLQPSPLAEHMERRG